MNKVELEGLKVGMEVKVKKTGDVLTVTNVDLSKDEDIVCGQSTYKHAALEFLGTFAKKETKEEVKEVKPESDKVEVPADTDVYATIGRVKVMKGELDQLPENFSVPNVSKAVKRTKANLLPMFVTTEVEGKHMVLAITSNKVMYTIHTSNLVSAKRIWNSMVERDLVD